MNFTEFNHNLNWSLTMSMAENGLTKGELFSISQNYTFKNWKSVHKNTDGTNCIKVQGYFVIAL